MNLTPRRAARATVHGYPRQGARRELKRAIEAHWAGRLSAEELLATVRKLRVSRWAELRGAGIDDVPSNDFSLYDHVLDTAWMLGAVPPRHRDAVPDVKTPAGALARYFAMARGTGDVSPLEMTKWFDTNYHYLVPELGPDTAFTLDAAKPLTEFREAADAGLTTRPVLLGPVTFLLLAKPADGAPDGFEPLSLLGRLLPAYVELLGRLGTAGAGWVQLDEPALVTDLSPDVLARVEEAYTELAGAPDRPRVLVGTYFDELGDALGVLAKTPVEGVALDFTGAGAANLERLASIGGLPGKRLVAGVVNGRNIWRTDLTRALATLGTLLGLAAEVDVATSCSLLHVPLDVTLEHNLDPQIASWFAFARQKCEEVAILARGLSSGRDAIAGELTANASRLAARAASPIATVEPVRARAAGVSDADIRRASEYPARHAAQQERLHLPPLPTTTIGSFPQTPALRRARADLRAGRTDARAYDDAMRAEVRDVVARQERLGLDVLVHGEPERGDMVQYFAEQFAGFVATEHGWVQSYGTRYVRPPIVVGDVWRPEPMTVEWARYAQSLTDKPVKGMLTGPVTMLAWSFVRDDQPLAVTVRQVALALRDEVADLEAAGVAVVQVDEPALRELLPLRRPRRADYLAWAVEAFRLTTAGARDDTQIHTHMCYAEFGDVLGAIVEMDADVISLEAARSRMRIIGELAAAGYPNDVGLGVWDIHSPRVPSTSEVADLLRAAVAAFPAERLWVNPDCGLKTRGYDEVTPSLEHLVAAARQVRSTL